MKKITVLLMALYMIALGAYVQCRQGNNTLIFVADDNYPKASVRIAIHETITNTIEITCSFSDVAINDCFEIDVYNDQNLQIYSDRTKRKFIATNDIHVITTSINANWTENVSINVKIKRKNKTALAGTILLKIMHPKALISSSTERIDLGTISESSVGLYQSNDGCFFINYTIYRNSQLIVTSNNNFRLRHEREQKFIKYLIHDNKTNKVIHSDNDNSIVVQLEHAHNLYKLEGCANFQISVDPNQDSTGIPYGYYSDVITVKIISKS
ncbi:MAG: hypothetical protein LBJ19_01475 [Holosporaceae bacterium]|jgi:hypothetical protein|nr:hypothetical protein [Holosporaceae bacterium]